MLAVAIGRRPRHHHGAAGANTRPNDLPLDSARAGGWTGTRQGSRRESESLMACRILGIAGAAEQVKIGEKLMISATIEKRSNPAHDNIL